MNLSVAIIDDSAADTATLCAIIKSWANKNVHSVSVKAYGDPAMVVEEFCDRPIRFDLLFIDVILPSIEGFDLVRLLQHNHPNMLFALMSANHSQFMKYGYGVGALDFLCKPFDSDYLFGTLDRAVLRIMNNTDKSFSFTTDKVTRKLPFSDILFFESCGNYVRLVTGSDSFLIRKTIKELSGELPESFVHSSRGCIINAAAISMFTKNKVAFCRSSKTVELSKSYIGGVRQAFGEYN